MEIRKQRNRLVKIANGILGYAASHMAMRSNRPRDLMTVVRMMGDTSLGQ